jgi:putative addiction module killer protein
MDAAEKLIRYYRDIKGKSPYTTWISSLKDIRGVQRIEARLTNLQKGNFGVARSVGGGVMELKIDFGPGYRVYFAREGSSVVILLCGGDKNSQSKDIRLAQDYWADYKERRA